MSFNHVKTARQLNQELDFHRESVEIDGLNLQRGSVIEFCGATGSGKISFLLNVFSQLSNSGEICAVVDVENNFDPGSADACRTKLNNILWIKCSGNLESAITATDYLIQARSFGAIWLNFHHTAQKQLNTFPNSTWYRYRTKIKDCPTILLVTSQLPVIGSAKNQSFFFDKQKTIWSGHRKFKLLKEFRLSCEIKKPTGETPVLTVIGKEY